MPKPRRQRESQAALREEWRKALAPAPKALKRIDATEGWSTTLSAAQSTFLIDGVRSWLRDARRDSHDAQIRSEGDVVATATRICRAVPRIFSTGSVLSNLIGRSAPIREAARTLQTADLSQQAQRVDELLAAEATNAASGDLRQAFRSARTLLAQAYDHALEQASQRPARTVRESDTPRRALLISLAWWWMDQGWTPTTAPRRTYLRVAGRLDRFRVGADRDTAFNTRTVRECIEAAAELRLNGLDANLDTPSGD